MDSEISQTSQLSKQVQELTETVAKLSACLEQARASTSAPSAYTDIDHGDYDNAGIPDKKSHTERQPTTGQGDQTADPEVPQVSATPEAQTAAGDLAPRATWSHPSDFFMATSSYINGFQFMGVYMYRMYSGGGASFLVIQVLCLLLMGIPLLFLELYLGQYSSQGPLSCWGFAPIAKGLGGAMVTVACIVAIYNIMSQVYGIYYFVVSCVSGLDWDVGYGAARNTSDDTNNTNYTYVYSRPEIQASQEFFFKQVLHLSDGLDDFGGFQWHLALCLLVAWVLVYLVLFGGIKVFGKVAYFTALFPIIGYLVLLCRALTMPGSLTGVQFIFKPDWTRTMQFYTWVSALMETFYFFLPATGGLSTLASYNTFRGHIFRNVALIAIVRLAVTALATFTFAALLGPFSHYSSRSLSDVLTTGHDWAFIAMPTALRLIPVSTLWCSIWFGVVVTSSLGCQVVLVETILTSLLDILAETKRYPRRWLILGAICLICLLFGLVFTFQGGPYIWYLLKVSCWVLTPLVAGLTWIVIVAKYGPRNLANDIKLLSGRRPHPALIVCVSIVLGLCVLVILWQNAVIWQSPYLKLGGYIYPVETRYTMWSISLFTLLPLVKTPVLLWRKTQGTAKERFHQLFNPTLTWGPRLPENRAVAIPNNRVDAVCRSGDKGDMTETV